MNKNEELHIFLTANDGYAQHLCVLMASILVNSKSETQLHFYILTDGISAANKEKINKLQEYKSFDFEYVLIDIADFARLPDLKHFSLLTYFRLKIPSLYPSLGKCLYMDCDIIVQNDLAELWNTDITEYYLAAVEYPESAEKLLSLGIPNDNSYFNAGMILMNLNKMRQDNIPDKTLDFIKNNRNVIEFPDQDGLNAIISKNWLPLDPKWNYVTFTDVKRTVLIKRKFDLKVARDNPYIIHYAGGAKPWMFLYRAEFKQEYRQYLQMTEFRDYRYEDFSFVNIFKKYIPETIKKQIKRLF